MVFAILVITKTFVMLFEHQTDEHETLERNFAD